MLTYVTDDHISLVKDYSSHAWEIGGIYLIWTFTHYTASHLYVKFCTPLSISGFILSPFTVATPHCSGLRWCINRGSETVSTMWITMGTWLTKKIVFQGRAKEELVKII